MLDAVLGLRTVMVVHHTDCGLTHISDEDIRKRLRDMVPEKRGEVEGMGTFGEIRE